MSVEESISINNYDDKNMLEQDEWRWARGMGEDKRGKASYRGWRGRMVGGELQAIGVGEE